MIKLNWEHLKAVILITSFNFLGGAFIFSGKPFLVFLGCISLIIGVIFEYVYLVAMDTRGIINQTRNQLQKYIEEAKKIKNEIQVMNDKIFDTFSQKGFKKVEERIKDLETQVEGRYGRNGLRDEFEELKREFKDFKRSLERVF